MPHGLFFVAIVRLRQPRVYQETAKARPHVAGACSFGEEHELDRCHRCPRVPPDFDVVAVDVPAGSEELTFAHGLVRQAETVDLEQLHGTHGAGEDRAGGRHGKRGS